MLGTQFSPWPSFTEEEANAARDVILSNKVNYWTGHEARHFEKEFAEWTGTRYAVALANGTVALDLALKALGVGVGDEVVVTSRTFLASVSSMSTLVPFQFSRILIPIRKTLSHRPSGQSLLLGPKR